MTKTSSQSPFNSKKVKKTLNNKPVTAKKRIKVQTTLEARSISETKSIENYACSRQTVKGSDIDNIKWEILERK